MTNTRNAPRAQRGLSLIAMLLFGVIAVMVVTVVVRVLPSLLEYQAIRKTLNEVATSTVASAADVQRAFDRQAAIDDIVSVKGTDLLIERRANGLAISVSYEKRVPLFGPVSLLIAYEASAPR